MWVKADDSQSPFSQLLMSHLNSFVRIPALAIRQRIRPLPRIGVLDEDVLRLRVWPQDIDFNLHLNNARYLSFMDYGRIHLTSAAGILTPAIRHRWAPLVGSISITYRRSLALFAPFTLATRLLCWDEKWLYMEQVFQSQDGLAAIAWVKGLFRGAEGNIPPQQIIDLVAPGAVSPAIPAALEEWNALTREKLASGE
jgi:acyl-CoA thioesterase FadM